MRDTAYDDDECIEIEDVGKLLQKIQIVILPQNFKSPLLLHSVSFYMNRRSFKYTLLVNPNRRHFFNTAVVNSNSYIICSSVNPVPESWLRLELMESLLCCFTSRLQLCTTTTVNCMKNTTIIYTV